MDVDIKPTRKRKVKAEPEDSSIAKPSKKVKVENVPEIHIDKENLLADLSIIDDWTASNLVKLFDEDNSIPFIARYRKHLTNGMDAEKLREVKENYETIIQIQSKAESLLKLAAKEGPVDPSLPTRLQCVKSLEEVELLAAPFKKGPNTSLASRAKKAGFEQPGLALLNGDSEVDPVQLVDPEVEGRADTNAVMTGLQHIVAGVIATDSAVLGFIDKLKSQERIVLQCSKRKSTTEVDPRQAEKFDNYKEFNQDVRYIKEHQVLAINRGETQKVLSVKVVIPDSFWSRFKTFCQRHWLGKGRSYSFRNIVFDKALDDSIHRLLSPLVVRQVRRQLTETAERSAMSLFSANLKRLLLSPPLRGKVVMALDPGKRNGCKLAIVSALGQPLVMDKIYLMSDSEKASARRKLLGWVKEHECEIVAIGNGSFCRETEAFLSDMIRAGEFRPLEVQYTIVDEQGVSIYSCSPTAIAEFPAVDPTLISAVSLARRLQDPLAELVKVEPKHLGVGMYQHDIQEKKLNSALDEVVSECVSFVGVDLNTASVHLLRRIAGLNQTRAEAIAQWRLSNGCFVNRQQLMKIKGIGEKTFQQCAGFARILPTTAKLQTTGDGAEKKRSKKSELNPLDQTEIHPEDYNLVKKILKELKMNVDNVGTPAFIEEMKRNIAKTSVGSLASSHDVKELHMGQLIEALQRPADHDMRKLNDAPLFQKSLTSLESVQVGDTLTGVVRNVVQFGAFVDVGVGCNGLIHTSKLPRDRSQWVQLGDRVQVRVLGVDISAKRLQLQPIGSR